ncbi:hypothetical protein Trydic_g8225 [Trypoxylus dichotomus]
MLRQGVLPSVFPWNKNKIEVKSDKIKGEVEEIDKNDEGNNEECSKTENMPEIVPQIKFEVTEQDFNASTSLVLKSEKDILDMANLKEEVVSPNQSTTIEQKVKTVETATGPLTFAPNTRIEALDFNQSWCPAQIVEVDYQENEVLVHFEKYSNKYDEWICMNSSTLRALSTNTTNSSGTSKKIETYEIGERCLATWTNARKFPATVSKIIDKDTYEVHFDDGYVKVLKAHRMSKATGKVLQASPLFDPVTGTKQERRDRKRKINVAALFGKRQRANSQEEVTTSKVTDNSAVSLTEEVESWTPKWENGRPVGEDSTIETIDGPRPSVIVPDPRLPPHWVKHLAQRNHGAPAGKWNSFIVNPDGRKFRTKSEIKAYIEENTELNLTESMFDFSISKKSRKSTSEKKHSFTSTEPMLRDNSPSESPNDEEIITELPNCLKIPVVDNAYKCPIEGCGKNFRRENLAQMHVKHYHPEYTKFLDSTPNVADLAYARTVGESLDRSPSQDKPRTPAPKPIQKILNPKTPISRSTQSPSFEIEQQHAAKIRDSEIIKLLSSKPSDGIKKDDQRSQSPILPSGLPPSMYPDIKLKDLLNKSEAIPKRDDINLKTLSASTQRPTGIKTLLPVTRIEPKLEENELENKFPLNKNVMGKHAVKRKRNASENTEVQPKLNKEVADIVVKTEPVPPEQPSNVIIEGGEVIKIVQMKREEIINCTCGITEEDGLMIQCELCLCWQHAYCNNIERESQVPEKYICYICQNPAKQRSSKKYLHDQDWLKHGTLAVGNYHCKDEHILKERFEKLKKSHDLSGALLELKDYMHTLRVKTKIAQAKNHPKSYLWSKLWEKLPLPEKMEFKDENQNTKQEDDHQYSKNDEAGDTVLLSLLKPVKDEVSDVGEFPKLDLNTLIENNLDQVPVNTLRIPQPEAAIDLADCRLNLLEHIQHSQSLVEERLNDFEEQINKLEPLLEEDEENSEEYPRLRQTTQMLMRDLTVFKELSSMTSF